MFTVGVKLRLSALFLNTATEAYYDPPNVVLKAKDPDEVVTTPSVTRDSEGHYHANVTPDQGGVWRWRWEGDTDAAREGQFSVDQSDF